MSYNNFKSACQKMKLIPDYESSGAISELELEKAEAQLAIHFSPQHREFLRQFNYVVFDCIELFGIQNNQNSAILEGNLVEYTLFDRQSYGLSDKWIPFFNFNDGTLAYFDYSLLNDANEPRIIRACYNGSYNIVEVLAEDFGDFLSTLVDGCI